MNLSHSTIFPSFKAYLEVQKKFPNRIIIIDGEKTKEEVKKASLEVVLKYLGDK